MSRRKRKYKPPTLAERYDRLRTRFVDSIDGYDRHSEQDNARVKEHLRARLDEIDALGVRTEQGALPEAVRELLVKANGRGVQGPVQALVFMFKRGSGQFFLWAYGPLPDDVLADPGEELMSNHRLEARGVIGDLGPIAYISYSDVTFELYDDDDQEYDLEFEYDAMGELLIVAAYRRFVEAFHEAFDPALVSSLGLMSPCLVYLQETGGGEATLVATL